jgi:HEAT repeat protein
MDALLEDAEVNGPSFWGMWVLSAHYHAPKERLLPLVLTALSDQDPEQREWAASELRGYEECGREALEALVRAVQDPEPKVRRAAVRSLWFWRQPEVVEALLYAIEDADPDVRSEAATGLGICDAVEAVPRLRGLLAREWSVAEPAIEALQLMKPPEALDALKSGLGSEDERARLRAAAALFARGDESIRPLLADGLEKANAELARLIHSALNHAAKQRGIPAPGERNGGPTSESEAWIRWLRQAR